MVDPWAGYNQSLNVLSHAAGMAQNDRQRQFTNALAEKQDARAESGQQFNQGMQSRAESRLLEDRPFERGLKESAEKRAGESHDQSTQINNINMASKKLEIIGKEMDAVDTSDPIRAEQQYQAAIQRIAQQLGPEAVAGMSPKYDANLFMTGKKLHEQETWNLKSQLVRAQIANQKAQTAAASTKTKDGRGPITKEAESLAPLLGQTTKETARMLVNDRTLGPKLNVYLKRIENLYGPPEEVDKQSRAIAKEAGVYDAVFGGDKKSSGSVDVESYAKDLVKQFGGMKQGQPKQPENIQPAQPQGQQIQVPYRRPDQTEQTPSEPLIQLEPAEPRPGFQKAKKVISSAVDNLRYSDDDIEKIKSYKKRAKNRANALATR